MKKNTLKKLIPAVIVSIFLIAFMLFYISTSFAIATMDKTVFSLVFALIGLLAIGCVVYVLVERAKELEDGLEDDLDKY